MQNFTISSWLYIPPNTKGYVFYEYDPEHNPPTYTKFLSVESSELVGIFPEGEEFTESVYYINLTVRINRTILSASIKTRNDILLRAGYRVFISVSYDWGNPLKMYYSAYPCVGIPELIEVTDFKQIEMGQGDEVRFAETFYQWGYLFNGEIIYNELNETVLSLEDINTKMLENIPDCEDLYPPTIAFNPSSQNLDEGDTLTLFIGYNQGNPPETTFEWRKDDILLINGGRISGADTQTLVIEDVEQGDEGSYICTVSNIVGSNESSAAIITVTDPPPPVDCFYDSGLEGTTQWFGESNIYSDIYGFQLVTAVPHTLNSGEMYNELEFTPTVVSAVLRNIISFDEVNGGDGAFSKSSLGGGTWRMDLELVPDYSIPDQVSYTMGIRAFAGPGLANEYSTVVSADILTEPGGYDSGTGNIFKIVQTGPTEVTFYWNDVSFGVDNNTVMTNELGISLETQWRDTLGGGIFHGYPLVLEIQAGLEGGENTCWPS